MTDDHSPEDPWEEAGARWASVMDKLRDHYRQLADGDAPDEEEVREALRTLGGAARALTGSVAEAMQDPEVRRQVGDAASSLADALARTLRDLGEELHRDPARSDGMDRDGAGSSST